MQFIVNENSSSQRLDQFLSDSLPDYSRSQLKRLIELQGVLVNDELVQKPSFKLHSGDELEMEPMIVETTLKPFKIDLEVLYEDNDLLFINKSPGLIVHPTPQKVNDVITLAHGLFEYLGPSILEVGHPLRPGIVHRLDKDTSGVMVIAKNRLTYFALVELFAQRKLEKSYCALVLGQLEHIEATIDSPIIRLDSKQRMMVADQGNAKNAVTHYKVREKFEQCSLLDIRLETGRTHQIRVHFASINHPLLGDDLYGRDQMNKLFLKQYGLKRQFLHASSLKLVHPSTKKELFVEAPLSGDLASVLSQLTPL